MSREKVLVSAYMLNGYNRLVRHFQDLVDEDKRVAVGNDLLDFFLVHERLITHSCHLPVRPDQSHTASVRIRRGSPS